jgi:aspartyl-tRNA synthetase
MSFISEDDIISVMEGLMAQIFKTCLGRDLNVPFPRLSYNDAIERYGKDNPDTRFAMEMKDLTNIFRNTGFEVIREVIDNGGVLKAIMVKDDKRLSRKDLDGIRDYIGTFGAKVSLWARVNPEGWTSTIFKYLKTEEVLKVNEAMAARDGDLIVFVADTLKTVREVLGNLRLQLAKKLDLIDPDQFAFTWITEFPLFEYSDTEKRYVSTHHPFTSPFMEDLPFLRSDPGRVRARAYDLVLNGSEIGGGSIRIHQQKVQALIFQALALGDEEVRSKFGYFLDALEFGTPPHGGIAFGLDRMIMMMSGAESIRDVIAFPKTQKATCLLTDAPTRVSIEQLMELSLKIV